jgi:lipopolysaccharide export LptBFGC system permease protein LptF
MPPAAALPSILVKSVLLALAAGYVAHRYSKVSIAALLLVVLAYQVVGTLFEWAWDGSFFAAIQDFRIGIPGMLLQIVGGYLFIKYVIRK